MNKDLRQLTGKGKFNKTTEKTKNLTGGIVASEKQSMGKQILWQVNKIL